MDRFEKMCMKLPVAFGWIEYLGETIFATFNYGATVKAKRPMLDIHYCATEAMNNRVLKTVQYDKNKFKTI